MRCNTYLLRISASLILVLSSTGLYAVEAGLPFTEDFVDTDSRDSTLTNANWSTEEQALFLAWRRAESTGTGNESDIDDLTDDTRSIALGDIDDDGDLDVVAGNSTVASVIYLNDGAGSFTRHQTLLDVSATRSVVLGDINGDGALDIVMGNHGGVNRLYLNNGSGVFPLNGAAIGSASDATTSISLGDVDGDGDLDLVSGSDDDSTQTNKLYLNNGDGLFASNGTAIGVVENKTTDTILIDVDDDGDLDLAIANYSNGVANKLYKNDGTGDFSANVSSIGVQRALTYSLAAGDVDGDGDIDFISGNHGVSNRFHLNFANTFINFETEIGVDDATDISTSVSLADSDNDGDIDLVVGNETGHTKRYINDGEGGFPDSGEIISSGEFNTYSTALGDVDGDGDIDIITGGAAETTKLYLNPLKGGGYAATGTAIGSEIDNTMAVVLGDVDDDGFLDLIAGNAGQTNKLYLNDGEGGFPEVGVDVGSTQDVTYGLVLADMDNDDDLDLIAGNWGTTNKIYLNDFSNVGTGDFLAATDIGLSTEVDTTTSIGVALVNDDAYLDVIVGNWDVTNKVYLNDADMNPGPVPGVFSTAGTDIGSEMDNTRSIALGDVDGLNRLDLVVGNRDQENRLYLHDGAEGFSLDKNIGSDTDDTLSLVLGNVDAGSNLDLIVGNAGQANKLYLNVSAFPAGGDGVAIGSETDVTTSVLLIDVDGDVDLDLLVGNDGAPDMRYLNDGTGAFSAIGAPINPGSITKTRALAVGDLDGLTDDNTDVDLVAAQYGITNKAYKNRLYQTHSGRVVSGKINTTETNFRGLFLSARAKVSSSTTRNTRIDYYLSNNGGEKWYRVLSNRLFAIPLAGSDLRWKAELYSLSPVRTPILNEITVRVNIAPVLRGGETLAVSVEGDQTAVTAVVATDDDQKNGVVILAYGIIGGDDREKFSLDIETGVLTFVEPPDFAAPTDSNGDNVYHVRVMVEDSGAGNPTDTQDIFVTVTNPPVPWIDGGGANSIGWLSLLVLLLSRRRN